MKKYIALALVLCSFSAAKAQKTRDVGTFYSVDVTDKIQVELIPSDKSKIEIEGENNENVDVVNKNGALRIKMNTFNILQGDYVSVKLYYTNLTSVSAKKGSKLISNPKETLSLNLLKIYAAEGALVNLTLKAKNLDVHATSGALVNLAGEATKQQAIVNLKANYEAKSLNTEEAIIAVNGGGIATVTASTVADVKTRGGGVITIHGNPSQRTESKFAGGQIIFK